MKAVVEYDGAHGINGTGDDDAACPRRRRFEKEGQIEHILVSNTGDAVSGAELTDSVIADSSRR